MPSINTLIKLIKLILLSLLILNLLGYDISTIALPLPSFQAQIRRLATFGASRISLPAASSLEIIATVVNAAAGGVVVRLICLSCALTTFITYRC